MFATSGHKTPAEELGVKLLEPSDKEIGGEFIPDFMKLHGGPYDGVLFPEHVVHEEKAIWVSILPFGVQGSVYVLDEGIFVYDLKASERANWSSDHRPKAQLILTALPKGAYVEFRNTWKFAQVDPFTRAMYGLPGGDNRTGAESLTLQDAENLNEEV